ncbi:alpha/beta fold hydrolase [soil metagenome]
MKKIIARLIGLYFNVVVCIAPRSTGKKAFYLFSSPQQPTLKPNHLDFFNTAEKFSLEVKGDRIQGYKWGTGKKILVFFHGWQSHTFRWKNYIEAFSKEEYTIYAMDAPGHGLSTGKHCNIPIYSIAIEEFLNGIPPVDTIVSHSLGSMSVLYAFYRRPSLNVKQLIITGTPGEGKEYVAFFQQTMGLSGRTMKALQEAFVKHAGHLPEFFSAIKYAGSLTIPMLSIHDEQDPETPYHHAVAIQKAGKKSRLITTTGLGHNLRSPVVIGYVVDFVEHGAPHPVLLTKEKVTS